MSANSFERKISDWLKAIPETFVYHPPDDPRTRQWKPADFIVADKCGWRLVECKEISKGSTFPLSRWTAQQRQFADRAQATGGGYVLLVHFATYRLIVAYRNPDPSATGSLSPVNGLVVTKDSIGDILRSS